VYHVSQFAACEPDRIAAIFPSAGESLTFAAMEAATNRDANALHSLGLVRGDCIGISITNRPEFLTLMLAAQRAGLFYVLLSTKLSMGDLAYIIDDAQAKVAIISAGCFAAERVAELKDLPGRIYQIEIPGSTCPDWTELAANQPSTLSFEPSRGREMLYSSGTTGKPKGVRKALSDGAFDVVDPVNVGVARVYGVGPGAKFYSPSPLYHAAPHRFANVALHNGATLIVPGQFDAAQSISDLAEFGCTHSLWVPTMFHRMLQLPETDRTGANLSAHIHAIHGAAPCPVHVKRQMIEWWGPILDEYYSGSEGIGSTNVTSPEWLAHPGSVGRPLDCKVHILDSDGNELDAGKIGDIYFESSNVFEYWKGSEKTKSVTSRQGWRTFGDIGYVDADGYLYLTDRKHFTIISGGVNIYPQEVESALLEHPEIKDAAVIGVPNDEFGQVAIAVVQLVDAAEPTEAMEAALRSFVRDRLGPVKTPKAIKFEQDFPRHATGKLYKQVLVEKYARAQSA
jgi:long-chain acyl-CoA synthetase